MKPTRVGLASLVIVGVVVALGCREPTAAEYAAAKLPDLIKKLKDPDPEKRARAADEIRALGTAYTKEALPHLFANFDDDHEKVRRYAAESVAFYGQDAVPGVLEALHSESPRRRAMGFIALATFPGDIKYQLRDQTLPLLAQALEDEDLEVRRYAAAAVRFHGSMAKSTLPIQLKVLENETDQEVILMLLHSLCTMGTDAQEALPVLNRMQQKGVGSDRVRNLLERAKFFVEGKDKEIDEEQGNVRKPPSPLTKPD